MHEWHLYYRTGKEVMVLGCPQLRVGKLFNVPDGIEDKITQEFIVEGYVEDYYNGTLENYAKPEPLSYHKTYLSRARILCTYKVDM